MKLTAEDIAAGKLVNNAKVSGTSPTGDVSSDAAATVEFKPAPQSATADEGIKTPPAAAPQVQAKVTPVAEVSKTGDGAPIAPLAIAFGICAAAACALTATRRRG
jgi:hypothetical protein